MNSKICLAETNEFFYSIHLDEKELQKKIIKKEDHTNLINFVNSSIAINNRLNYAFLTKSYHKVSIYSFSKEKIVKEIELKNTSKICDLLSYKSFQVLVVTTTSINLIDPISKFAIREIKIRGIGTYQIAHCSSLNKGKILVLCSWKKDSFELTLTICSLSKQKGNQRVCQLVLEMR